MKRGLWVLAVIAGAVLVAAVSGGPRAGGPPLDPSSTSPDGARALVETLERLGFDVAVVTGEPTPTARRALVIADPGLDPRVVEDWVADGRVLVVADVSSVLHPGGSVTGRASGEVLAAGCDLRPVAGLSVVGDVELAGVPPGTVSCFEGERGSWLVAAPSGRGVVVGLADPEPFLNRSLDEGDHAAVAAGLLGADGAIEIVRPTRPGEGPQSLRELVPSGVELGLVQAGFAAVLYALVRARRLGRPVVDDRPVEVPAASLVHAIAGLRQRSGARRETIERIVVAGRRRLATAVGLDPHSGDEALVQTVASRSGRSTTDVEQALHPGEPADDEAMVGAARSIHEMIREVERRP